MKTVFFSYRDETVIRYTDGECGALAEAISRRTGWPISVLEDDEGPKHAVVRTPDGRYLDIEGLWTARDLISRWQLDYLEIRLRQIGDNEWNTAEELRYWHERPYVTAAGPFARRVIERALKEFDPDPVVIPVRELVHA